MQYSGIELQKTDFEKVHQLVNLRLCNMADIDYALRLLLQNKVRRQILERLVREPHYPMQLAAVSYTHLTLPTMQVV